MEHEVEILCTPSHQAKAVIEGWEEEDFYYTVMKKSVAGHMNRLARVYPHIGSGESCDKRFLLKTRVPIDGPLHIVYLDGRSDAGLPHTRGKHGIALPVFLLWNPRQSTLEHEVVHLSQKQYKSKWWAFYRKHWDFREASAAEFMSIPVKWRDRRRINPDTLGNPYTVWSNRFIPLSVFINEMSPKLTACKRGFWDLKMSQWTWEPPSGWVDLFGSGFNDEHPNEIAAHWLDGSAGEDKKYQILI
jgi:hypothetical protein